MTKQIERRRHERKVISTYVGGEFYLEVAGKTYQVMAAWKTR